MKIVSLVFVAAILISFGFTLIATNFTKKNGQKIVSRPGAFEKSIQAEHYMRLASWD